MDTGLNVKDLAVDAPGEGFPVNRDTEFVIARAEKNSFGTFARVCPTGKFDIFFSVGNAYGTPTIALPYAGDDGHKRYKMGSITVTE